eukprot:Rhum_TRINITY_DN15366_c4_g3::Rhum_TRINITY_DN15366_c4_g3_i3::g.150114::m.150114
MCGGMQGGGGGAAAKAKKTGPRRCPLVKTRGTRHRARRQRLAKRVRLPKGGMAGLCLPPAHRASLVSVVVLQEGALSRRQCRREDREQIRGFGCFGQLRGSPCCFLPVLVDHRCCKFVPLCVSILGADGVVVHPFLLPNVIRQPLDLADRKGRRTALREQHRSDNLQQHRIVHSLAGRGVRHHTPTLLARHTFQRVHPRHRRRHERKLAHPAAAHVADKHVSAGSRRRHLNLVGQEVERRCVQAAAGGGLVPPRNLRPVERRGKPVAQEGFCDAAHRRECVEHVLRPLRVLLQRLPVVGLLQHAVEALHVQHSHRHASDEERRGNLKPCPLCRRRQAWCGLFEAGRLRRVRDRFFTPVAHAATREVTVVQQECLRQERLVLLQVRQQDAQGVLHLLQLRDPAADRGQRVDPHQRRVDHQTRQVRKRRRQQAVEQQEYRNRREPDNGDDERRVVRLHVQILLRVRLLHSE